MKHLISAGACALLLAACGGGNGAVPSAPAAPAAALPNTALPSITVVAPELEVLSRTQFSGVDAPRTAVATNAEQWAKLWADYVGIHPDAPAMPAVDFGKRQVIGVFLGPAIDGCAIAHIRSVEKTAQKLVVTYAARAPESGQMIVDCIYQKSTPGTLVSVERTDLPVEFVKVPETGAVSTLTIAREIRSNVREARTAVVTTQADWTALWREHSDTKAPDVDFTKSVVVAIFGGQSGSCDELEVRAGFLAGTRTIVEYSIRPPYQPVACTKDIKSPAAFVTVPRVEGGAYSVRRVPPYFIPASKAVQQGTVANVIEQSDASLLFQGTREKINSDEAWADFWRRHHGTGADAPALPKVDFTLNSVVAIVEGTTLGGPGCASLVVDVHFEANTAIVAYGTRPNPTFAVCAPGPVNRSVIATIPKSLGPTEFRPMSTAP